MKLNLTTTTDCVDFAKDLLELAKGLTTREQHARIWDLKVELLHIVNNAFESGAFTGEAYEELWEAKHLIKRIEDVAGVRSSKTYAKKS